MECTNKPATLIDLAADFVKTLNLAMPSFDLKKIEQLEELQTLQDRITKIMMKLEKSEENASLLLDQLERSVYECRDVVYIRKDGALKGIISRDTVKPEIRPIQKLETDCNCTNYLDFDFKEIQDYFIVETEKKLRELDDSLKTVILGVFDHDYRTYKPFTCIIAIYIPEGYVYLIDAIKFRFIIPELRLFKCGVKKVFASQYDVDRIIDDFGLIGCYCNFNTSPFEIVVDWRIRPINEVFISVIGDIMAKTAEKVNLKISTEIHIPQQKEPILEFIDNFQLGNVNIETVEDLFKLRDYLARTNNEGAQYVMTDKQLFNLIVNMPSSLEELEALLGRMSPVLRLHAIDFLLIMNRKSKVFSLEELKSKKETLELNSQPLNNPNSLENDKKSKFYNFNEFEESDLEISCESE